MHRFFVSPEHVAGSRVRVYGQDAIHLTRVLRLGRGARFIACYGGNDYLVEIERPGPPVEARVLRRLSAPAEPPVHVTLYQALPKKSKMEDIIERCTELGVRRIVPLSSARSVVRLDSGKAAHKTLRWQKIARESAELAGRTFVPEVAVPTSLQAAVALDGSDLRLLLWESEKARGFKHALQGARHVGSLSVLVGPEGGLTAEEVEWALSKGFLPVSLGPRILRTENAGPTAVALVQYELGDLGSAPGGDGG